MSLAQPDSIDAALIATNQELRAFCGTGRTGKILFEFNVLNGSVVNTYAEEPKKSIYSSPKSKQ